MTADAARAYVDGGDPCPKHRGVGVQPSCPDCDQPYAPTDDSLARVRAFCEAYPNRRGIDPDTIYGLDGGVFAGGTELRLSDLLALLGAVARVEALPLALMDEATRTENREKGVGRGRAEAHNYAVGFGLRLAAAKVRAALSGGES